jgi:hypothetical protein
VVADRGVAREQRPGGNETGDAVITVIDGHDPGHRQAVGAVAEHAVGRETGDHQRGHRVVADALDHRAGLEVDLLRQDAHPGRAEHGIAQRLRDRLGGHQNRAAGEVTGPAQGDPVGADLDALVINPRLDQHRVTGTGLIDRGLDGLTRAHHDRS